MLSFLSLLSLLSLISDGQLLNSLNVETSFLQPNIGWPTIFRYLIKSQLRVPLDRLGKRSIKAFFSLARSSSEILF